MVSTPRMAISFCCGKSWRRIRRQVLRRRQRLYSHRPRFKEPPAEFAETRFPIVVERLALAQDSGGAGKYRGGLGYQKDIRVLQDVEFISTADRSILSCYGVKGGKAGLPYRATSIRAARTKLCCPGWWITLNSTRATLYDLRRPEVVAGVIRWSGSRRWCFKMWRSEGSRKSPPAAPTAWPRPSGGCVHH